METNPLQHVSPDILVVEDERSLLSAVVTILEKEGYIVVSARSAKEALDLVIRHQPPLIVADVLMPGMSGIDMLKRLRGYLWGYETPVIFYSNLNQDEVLPQTSSYGSVYYLQKSDPESVVHLLSIIESEFRKRKNLR